MLITSALVSLLAVSLLMTSVWAIHLRTRDASIVDPMWGLAIVLAGGVYVAHAAAVGGAEGLVGGSTTGMTGRAVALVIALAWAGRLGTHLGIRHSIEGEDRRYAKMREKRGEAWPWVSLPIVFLLQAALAFGVALPLMGLAHGDPGSIGILGWIGLAVALGGFMFEAVADGQLARFKLEERERLDDDPDAEKGVMDSGLWRYSRHPNYFGESLVWWGFGLVSVGVGEAWGLLGPALITFMLLKVSGVTMTEEEIESRRPAYADYIRRTNGFIPGPPRASS